LSKQDFTEKIVSLSKRRGFIFQSSELYGGLNGCYDYGPLGVELLRNIKDAWWKEMTFREDIEGLDASILMHPKVWEASGHIEHFTDPLVDCKECKARFRADQLEDVECGNKAYKGRKAIKCQQEGKFTEARNFNMMFKTYLGSVEDSSDVIFIRPETAQGIYLNFLNVKESSRQKLPFGIAQVGKAFRNEINTKYFLFRTREFEQMEMQFFVKPSDDNKWFDYWQDLRMNWFKNLGMRNEKLRFHEHNEDELPHYAKQAVDIEYEFPFGWGELVMAFLIDAYEEEEITKENSDGSTKTEIRNIMHFHPELAPIKAAIFPLVNRDGMPEIARKITEDMRKYLRVFYDESGAVGRRYRRQDECGTPYCITIDSDTLIDGTVTIRDRDSMAQERINKDNVVEYIKSKLKT
jgi:glycyl-tRNA synthetase